MIMGSFAVSEQKGLMYTLTAIRKHTHQEHHGKANLHTHKCHVCNHHMHINAMRKKQLGKHSAMTVTRKCNLNLVVQRDWKRWLRTDV